MKSGKVQGSQRLENKSREEFAEMVHAILSARFPERIPQAFVHTYGCQGNVADSERIKGLLVQMGYAFCDRPEDADLVLFNTCAVREHAEDRVFGNVGALKPIKAARPGMIIALCGCMMQQAHVEERISKSFPYVNLVFGTFAVQKLPELLFRVLSGGKRVFETGEGGGEITEGLPTVQDRPFKVWLPVMYGCDNFCSYCVVPYVRGRERSRMPEEILKEAEALIANGAKDITLLGQNVNSYGKNLPVDMNFAKLLRQINALPGDFLIRFMTSHPKDCSEELLDTMAGCEKVSKHLHLPFQAGSDRVLDEMNRGYTKEQYLRLLRYARKVMPDMSVTSDVIVGFPGESYEEFQETLALVREAQFTSLFTFIYSKRSGTVAADLPDPVPYSEKSSWFSELTALQEDIAGARTAKLLDSVHRVLVEERDESKGLLMGRTSGNISILFDGSDSLIGGFVFVRVTEPKTWVLYGELCEAE
ncbi:MAG: tRNA (N6-isopentenyl adenosine(37)-C2)-methylthiotransferase MiaB [Oscillospiraceae bacterium]|nr:tRNA (N6-isopentenyl adenosine(37)-C2)-methylthiotransferase MiaB [Oscillospiraceae bacterium]